MKPSLTAFVVQYLDPTTPEYAVDTISKPAPLVNIKLYHSSKTYHAFVVQACDYLLGMLKTTLSDAATPKSIAAPALGIPLNIIAMATTNYAPPKIYINAKIVGKSNNAMTAVTSSSPIFNGLGGVKLKRYDSIDIEYCNSEGVVFRQVGMDKDQGGFFFQNEIDVCNGVMILDRAESKDYIINVEFNKNCDDEAFRDKLELLGLKITSHMINTVKAALGPIYEKRLIRSILLDIHKMSGVVSVDITNLTPILSSGGFH